MPETERTLGDHGARLKAVEDDLHEIKKDLKEILAQLNGAKGGWRVVMLVAGIAGTLGGFLVKYAPFLGAK
jgi:hypothetical protein